MVVEWQQHGVVVAAACGILLSCDYLKLAEFGGHGALNRDSGTTHS